MSVYIISNRGNKYGIMIKIRNSNEKSLRWYQHPWGSHHSNNEKSYHKLKNTQKLHFKNISEDARENRLDKLSLIKIKP